MEANFPFYFQGNITFNRHTIICLTVLLFTEGGALLFPDVKLQILVTYYKAKFSFYW